MPPAQQHISDECLLHLLDFCLLLQQCVTPFFFLSLSFLYKWLIIIFVQTEAISWFCLFFFFYYNSAGKDFCDRAQQRINGVERPRLLLRS
jgi:hypothetical protein